MSLSKNEVSRLRILDALADDGEFLEEIYLHCSFSQSDTTIRPYRCTYRLWEVLDALRSMVTEGLVLEHLGHGFSDPANVAHRVFVLTESGQQKLYTALRQSGPEWFEL
jgi:hypothetical protein